MVSIMQRCGFTAEEVAFIGDDIIDMEIFGMCKVSVTIEDAPKYVQEKANIVLNSKGGYGAFREFVDMILHKIIKIESKTS